MTWSKTLNQWTNESMSVWMDGWLRDEIYSESSIRGVSAVRKTRFQYI